MEDDAERVERAESAKQQPDPPRRVWPQCPTCACSICSYETRTLRVTFCGCACRHEPLTGPV